MNLVDENDIEELDVPGRTLRWLINSSSGIANHCSMNVVTIAAGSTVRPAHEHPDGEEIMYVVSGSGEALVDGEVGRFAAGTAVLFSEGSVHMIRNSGTEPLKLACFFAPAADFDSYKYHDAVKFPDEK